MGGLEREEAALVTCASYGSEKRWWKVLSSVKSLTGLVRRGWSLAMSIASRLSGTSEHTEFSNSEFIPKREMAVVGIAKIEKTSPGLEHSFGPLGPNITPH